MEGRRGGVQLLDKASMIHAKRSELHEHVAYGVRSCLFFINSRFCMSMVCAANHLGASSFSPKLEPQSGYLPSLLLTQSNRPSSNLDELLEGTINW
jgi:hypothetical protein